MTPEAAEAARREEWDRDGKPLEPRWKEHPPGVLRAFGWYIRNAIEGICHEAEKGKIAP